MEILMMIGSYAGEIRDVRPHHAHGLIERGEAIDPNAPLAEFHSGGVVPPGEPILVGENPQGSFLPKAVVDNLVAAVAAVNKKAKR